MIATARGVQSHRVGLFLGIALGLVAGPAAAVGVRIVSPETGTPVVAGQLVEVRWEQLPDEVDEMELLLEMNSGAVERLRLTPQLDGATRSYLWRVPNLVARGVRLRLRWGRDGVETEGEPSAPFSIRPDTTRPLDGVRFSRGEWWVGRGLADIEPVGKGHGGVVPPGADGSLTGVISMVTEVAPDGTGVRLHHPRDPSRRRGSDTPIGPGLDDHGPLTIPLRP